MKLKILNFIKKLSLRFGINISSVTSSVDLDEFLRIIKPFATNHKLIRIGREDGGYLIPNDLIGIGECFSPGVSDTADFEADMVQRGVKCYLADYSVVAPPFQHDLIDFEKKFLGAKEGNGYITINKWIEQKSKDKTDLILQMDIESAEYEVILDISIENLKKFRILVIEFHQMDLLLNKHAFRYIKQAFQKILDIYDVVHIHPNNCMPPLKYQKYEIPPVLEFTFLRKDRVVEKTATKNFPHDLDRANVSGNVDYALPVMFYKD